MRHGDFRYPGVHDAAVLAACWTSLPLESPRAPGMESIVWRACVTPGAEPIGAYVWRLGIGVQDLPIFFHSRVEAPFRLRSGASPRAVGGNLENVGQRKREW